MEENQNQEMLQPAQQSEPLQAKDAAQNGGRISENAGGEKRSFEELIRGEYREDFQRKIDSILEKRFRKNGKLSEIADKIQREFGIGDEETLMRRLSEGARAGEHADDFRVWQREGEKLRAEYPDFDFAREAENPEFLRLLRSGAPIREAYEFAHRSELMSEAIRYTADRVKESVLSDIRARGIRPAENGTSKRSTAAYKNDVRALSRADREEVSRRVLRGETIRF